MPFFVGVGGGLELAYCPDSGVSPFIGAKYMSNTYFTKATSSYYGTSTESKKYSVGNFAIYAGIKMVER
jgi:hypothetical protein